MTAERLELTVLFGERARADGGFLADAIAAIFARHELHLSVVLRGMAGFGAAQRLRTDRLLSLSEDLPIVTVAVDARDRIEAALRDIEALAFHPLATTERDIASPGEHAKLTVYARRGEHRGVVAALHRHGVAGATALLGVDGTVRGVRRRARLVGDNRDVPVMVVSVGETDRIGAALAELPGGRVHARARAHLPARRHGPRRAPRDRRRMAEGQRLHVGGHRPARRPDRSACAATAPRARPSCGACGATTEITSRTATGCCSFAAGCRS